MHPKYPSIFLINFSVSLIFVVKAAPQLPNNEIITSLTYVSRQQPSSDEIQISEGDSLELECTGLNNVTFIYPKYYFRIPQSTVEIKHHYINNMHKAIVKRKNSVHGDTGWYGCVDLHKLSSSKNLPLEINPDSYKEANVKWIYVYVKSTSKAFHGNVGKYANFYEIIGDNIVLPCRVNSPEYSVVCYHDDEKVDTSGKRVSYDPRKGLVIMNVTVQDSGYYQCYDNVYSHTVSYMLHVTKKLADLYNPVISQPDEDELILGEQLRFNCTAEFSYKNSYSLKWTLPQRSERVSINSYLLQDDMNSFVMVKELVIEKANIGDQGQYVCTASSNKKTNSTSINVELKKPSLVNCSSKKDLYRAISGLKDSILQEMKSSLESMIVNAVEKSVSKNIELQLASIKSKLDMYLLS